MEKHMAQRGKVRREIIRSLWADLVEVQSVVGEITEAEMFLDIARQRIMLLAELDGMDLRAQ
jgi:hypothetical protein